MECETDIKLFIQMRTRMFKIDHNDDVRALQYDVSKEF